MTNNYHRHYHFTPEEQEAGVFMFDGSYDKMLPDPTPPFYNYNTNGQSGVAALWFALHLGYDRVYTVGLDFCSIVFPQGMKYDQTIAQEFMNNHVKGTQPVNGTAGLGLKTGKPRLVPAALETINSFPDQHVFKVHEVSLMPCEVAEPPTKGV